MDWKTYEEYKELSLKSMPKLCASPVTLVVLGSGLSEVVSSYEILQRIEFRSIAMHPVSRVAGHPGEYVICRVRDEVVVFSLGRVHLYEGFHPLEVAYGISLWHTLGVKQLILTNASGGIKDYPVGSVVAIRDHINHQGVSPLTGCPYPERFVSMMGAYDEDTIKHLEQCGIVSGVYAGVSGPQYESPAEIRALSVMGATLVGMSTVQETLMARYLGLRICGLSVVTNRAAGFGTHHPDHHRVLDAAKLAYMSLTFCIEEVVGFWRTRA